jgi:hypothetical protein
MKLVVFFLMLATVTACSRKPESLVQAPTGAWISLFNGRDLSDWTVKIAGQDLDDNYRDTFRVENGLLKVSYQNYDKFENRFGSLFFRQKFSHYWIRAEYRFVGSLASGAPRWAYKNSGLQLHSQAPETMRKDQQFPVSVEFDIVGGHMFGSAPTGDVCQNGTHVMINGDRVNGLCSKVSDVTLRNGDWVTVLAEVDGSDRVRQVVNGVLIVEYTTLTLDENNQDARRLMAAGADKALGSGYVSIQSNGFPIEFRRIEVLPIGQHGPERGG